MSVFNFFKSYFYLLKYPFLIGTLCVIIADFCGRLGTYYGSRLIGLISSDAPDRYPLLTMAVIYICLYAGLATARQVIINISNFVDAKYLPYIQGMMLKKMFTHVHKHPSFYFEQEMSGNIASKITNIVTYFEKEYYTFYWALYQPALTILTVIISVIWVKPSIGFMLIFTLIVFFYIMYRAACTIIPINRETARLLSLTNAAIIDSVTNIETVKSFGHACFEKKNLFKILTPTAKVQRKNILLTRKIYRSQGIGRALIQFMFAAIPLFYWAAGELSLADYVFIQGVVLSMTHQTGSIIDDLVSFLSQYAVLQEALDLIYRPFSVQDKPHAGTLNVTKGQLQIQDITFQYKGQKPLFKHFSLDIKPGVKLGLIGYSGSGKSTLIKLINRYYDVSKGGIFIDGQNISDVTLRSLHRHIAYIPQEPSLLNRTIMENIRYANPGATDEQVFEAAKKAYCHDFIQALPNGYQSKVGERGVMLSGGERQRIAIARAILKKAPILILDEATSALDSESERYIQNALNHLMAGKTVIAIAHRLSTLKKMDQVVAFEKGHIIEHGSPNQLMKKKGLYRQFYDMQSMAFIGE